MRIMWTSAIIFFLILATISTLAHAQTSISPSTMILIDSPTIAWAPTVATPDASVALTTAASRTFTVSGMQTGQPYTISLHQVSAGGAATLVLGAGCLWYGATGAGFGPLAQINLTSAAGASDMLQISYNGTVCAVIQHSFPLTVQ